jgi:hypothetical protein
MMASLFLLFVIDMVLAWRGERAASMVLFFITFILCALMFWHHISEPLNIDL